MRSRNKVLIGLSVLSLSAAASAEDDGPIDFGATRDAFLLSHTEALFGFKGTVANSTASVTAIAANADPRALVTVARGLKVKVVTAAANAGANIDQIVLWPNDHHPTHLIVANEQGTTDAGVQRIRLSDGLVETVLTGTTAGDPIRATPWGTILAGEEAGTSGQMIEILNPLATTNVVFDRVTGLATNGVDGSGAQNVAARWALGRLSFEGLAILPSGVVYYGDENRPGGGNAGGAYYKFIPAVPYMGGAPIDNLAQSPLVAGQVYGLKLSRGTNNGQGNNTGLGVWVAIPDSTNANLRAAAATLKLTGYYRPEDLDLDRRSLAAGNVRACGNNTGNEADGNWGETICITDGPVAGASTNVANPEVQLFVVGTSDFAMSDNIAFHPTKAFWAINEDGEGPTVGKNNDLWACLEDGADADTLSDGCVRFASLNDLNAESTGGVFDGTGRHYYVSVQHNVTGHGVVLDITGWDGGAHDR